MWLLAGKTADPRLFKAVFETVSRLVELICAHGNKCDPGETSCAQEALPGEIMVVKCAVLQTS